MAFQMEVFCTRACKVVSPEVSQAPRVEMPAARLAGELLDAPVASALEVDGRVVSRQRAGSQGVRERARCRGCSFSPGGKAVRRPGGPGPFTRSPPEPT